MGKKKRRKEKQEVEDALFESDEYHYFIAGYTSGGASYGITWEEAEAEGLLDDDPSGEDAPGLGLRKGDSAGMNTFEDDDLPF